MNPDDVRRAAPAVAGVPVRLDDAMPRDVIAGRCSHCRGDGTVIARVGGRVPCNVCNGTGVVARRIEGAGMDVRLVPMTRAQRDYLNTRASLHLGLSTIVARWDAAPADPAETVAAALYEINSTTDEDYSMDDARTEAPVVLAALGFPSSSRDETGGAP